jgi:dephospho-CoA kinase
MQDSMRGKFYKMIIGVCGRIGAGKETLTKFLTKEGFEYFETRRVLNEHLTEQGKELSRTNMQDLADKWRSEDGVGALMKKIIERLDLSKNHIIDSLRNFGEAEFLRQELGEDFILIGVDAPREIRFERIKKRGKQSDLLDWENFLKVDERDNFDPDNPMGQQTGKCIEGSDFVVMNDKDLNSAMEQVKKIWNEIN